LFFYIVDFFSYFFSLNIPVSTTGSKGTERARKAYRLTPHTKPPLLPGKSGILLTINL
jgi:hypothetical protein